MIDARQAFSTTLRTQREQLGITLSDIANTTKINGALLAALERGDVSRWPGGIYRRAFFREYALAIGLSSDTLLNEFVRLFPDEPTAASAKASAPRAAAAHERPAEFRLALVVKDTPASVALKRLAVVVAELAGVALMGAGSSWLVAVDMLPAIGVTALAYYPVANLCVDRTMGIRRLRALVKSPIPIPADSEARRSETRRYEEIEGHEELQVSF